MKKLLFFILRYSGAVALFRFIKQRDKVSILLFHDLDVEVAKRVFPCLKRNYSIISLGTYVEALLNKSKAQIPANALILTFDDGHIGNFAMTDLAQKYDVPLTIFLCSSIVGTNRHFWFLHPSIQHLLEDCKRVPNQQRLDLLQQHGFEQDRDQNAPHALQLTQIRNMQEAIDFQGHTRHHPILPSCDDEEARDEIEGGKSELESMLGRSLEYFAYPNGDYSIRDEKIVKEAGYRAALTVDFGFNDLQSNPWRLKRVPINDTSDLNEVIVKASGLWSYFKTRNGKKQKCGLMKVFYRPAISSKISV